MENYIDTNLSRTNTESKCNSFKFSNKTSGNNTINSKIPNNSESKKILNMKI